MGIIDQLDSAGALPAIEAAMRFAGRRHEIIAHNIANLETPNYRTADVDPVAFQKQLAQAIDQKRKDTGGGHGRLHIESTQEVEVGRDGSLRLNPKTETGNILFHDRANRDLERTMQSLVENAGMFRLATDLYRNRTTALRMAIAERAG